MRRSDRSWALGSPRKIDVAPLSRGRTLGRAIAFVLSVACVRRSRWRRRDGTAASLRTTASPRMGTSATPVRTLALREKHAQADLVDSEMRGGRRHVANRVSTVCESGWGESGPLRRVRRIDVSEVLSKSRGSPAPPSEGFESVSKQWTKSSATRASPMGSGPRTVTRGASGRWCQAPLQGVTEFSPTVVVARPNAYAKLLLRDAVAV